MKSLCIPNSKTSNTQSNYKVITTSILWSGASSNVLVGGVDSGGAHVGEVVGFILFFL